jgi:hypothetical protein
MVFYVSARVSTAYGNEKKLWMPIAGLGGFVPYVWSLYVIFYDPLQALHLHR